ncbi:hypothetical protein DBR45_45765 [Pseudomonas sp. HMWF031]|nr:hypothetical protein DBR45_45765 [Pseudomonas sp. HMWF031]
MWDFFPRLIIRPLFTEVQAAHRKVDQWLVCKELDMSYSEMSFFGRDRHSTQRPSAKCQDERKLTARGRQFKLEVKLGQCLLMADCRSP